MRKEICAWNTYMVGDKVHFRSTDFDGVFDTNGIVKAVYKDHVLVSANGLSLWLDKDTEEFFSKI